MQYQSECLSALKSVVNIHKPFEKTFMDTMKLFMVIPDRINFLQLGKYGRFSEQTIGNHGHRSHRPITSMTLGFIQTPDCKSLENMDRNLVDWYSSFRIDP